MQLALVILLSEKCKYGVLPQRPNLMLVFMVPIWTVDLVINPLTD